jgi:hypothetical protein
MMCTLGVDSPLYDRLDGEEVLSKSGIGGQSY